MLKEPQRCRLIKKEFLEKLIFNKGDKSRALEQFETYGTTSTANVKHGAIASQINIKPHTTDIFTLVPIIQYTISHCKSLQSILEDKKKLYLKKKSKYHETHI